VPAATWAVPEQAGPVLAGSAAAPDTSAVSARLL